MHLKISSAPQCVNAYFRALVQRWKTENWNNPPNSPWPVFFIPNQLSARCFAVQCIQLKKMHSGKHGSGDNGSTRYWPPGPLHTHECRWDWFFIWNKILCIEYILWRILPTKTMFDVANVLKELTKSKSKLSQQLWASKHTGLFIHHALKQGLHPISSGKLKVLSSFPDVH